MHSHIPGDSYRVRLKNHGSRQIELKVHFPVKQDKKKVMYNIDMYLFTPSQLRLNKTNYGVESFISDLHAYTRFSSPSIPLEKLIDGNCEVSPLTRIKKLIENGNLEQDKTRDKIHFELQTLTNVVRSEIRNIQILYREMMLQDSTGMDLNYRIIQTLEEINRFLASLRKLHIEFLHLHVDEFLRTALCWSDEAVSIYVEKLVLSLYSLCSKKPHLSQAADVLSVRLTREPEYRKASGYAHSLIDPSLPITGERRLYRESTLKKWSQSAMYMTQVASTTPKKLAHLFASIAAALAMAVAVIVAFLADRIFVSYSLPWIFIIVASYMLKDRMKEVVRSILIAVIPRIIADIINNLIDKSSGQKVGKSRTLITFPSAASLPESIMHIRDHKKNPFRVILPEENIICFHKETYLNCAKLLSAHSRLEALTGIVRFKMDRWFTEMDNPTSEIKYSSGKKLLNFRADRVYHAHMVLRLSRQGETDTPSFYHYLIVVNRNGIVRIEQA